LDLLSQLVNKSLVVMQEENGESRFHRLETIRQYAREKLFETTEAAHIRDRHLDYFIQLADQSYEELMGPNDLSWNEKLETENDNLRTALSWSLESPDIDPQKGLQLSGAMQDFWDTRGYTSEGFQWLSNALKKAPDAPTSQRCRALHGAGLLSVRLTRNKDADQYLEESLTLARQLNIMPLLISSLCVSTSFMENRVEARQRLQEGFTLARAAREQYYLAKILGTWAIEFSDNHSEEIRYIQEASEIAEKQGNSRMRAFVLWHYGATEMRSANYDSATSMLREALRLSQLLKDKHTTAHCLMLLGRVATRHSNYADAVRYEDESLQIFRDLSDRFCSMEALFHLGWNAYLASEKGRAIEHFQECLSICREIDIADVILMPTFALGRIALSHGDIYKAKSYFLEALEAHKKSQDSPYFLAYCLEAVCAIPTFPPAKAARLLGRAEAIREKRGYVLAVPERHLVDPIIEKLRSQLGDEAFDSARAAGMALTDLQVIEDAIEVLQLIE